MDFCHLVLGQRHTCSRSCLGHSNYFPKHFVIEQFVKGFAVLQRRVFYVWHFRLCRSLRCQWAWEWRNRSLRSADCGTSKHTVWQAAPHWGATSLIVAQASKQAVWRANCTTLGGHITLLQLTWGLKQLQPTYREWGTPAYLHSRQLNVRSSLKQSGVEAEKKLKIRRELEMFGQARRRWGEPWKEREGWGEKAKQENRRRLDTRWAKQKHKGAYKENPAEQEK